MRQPLVLPMAFYVLYIWFLTVLMFRTRVRAVRTGEISIKYFKTYTGQPPGDRTILVARHYDNQFQVPVLFFIVCTLHIFLGLAGPVTLGLAWAFVLSRLLHSWVHLGSNRLQKRVACFAAGWIIVLLLWAQLVYFAL